MKNDTHPSLDLAGSIRPGLDILANEIVIALKKRTRFKVNLPIYQPGLLRKHPNSTLLDYELALVERQHAELGRFAFAEQDAFTDVADIELIMDRTPDNATAIMPSRAGDKIKQFYLGWIQQACEPGVDDSRYGETVTSDVAALMSIMERVNLGKLVAESKFQSMPEAFRATNGDRQHMLQHIVRKDREEAVLAMAADLGKNYGLKPSLVVSVFDFMISTTVDIEVDYLQMRLANEAMNDS